MEDLYRAIHADPEFKRLEAEKSKLSWRLTAAVLAFYFSFILIIAFQPSLFARPLYEGSTTTWGIPIGLFVIVCSFLLTGLYVHYANSRFDPGRKTLIKAARTRHDDRGNGA